MLVTLTDGKELRTTFPLGCVGYVAKKIEIEPEDIKAMRMLAENHPEEFSSAMKQFAARFASERASTTPVLPCQNPPVTVHIFTVSIALAAAAVGLLRGNVTEALLFVIAAMLVNAMGRKPGA